MEKVAAHKQSVDPFAYSQVIFDFDGTLAKLLIDWYNWERAIAKLIHTYEPNFPLDQDLEINHFVINQYITRYGDAFRNDFIRVSSQAEKDNYHGYEVIDNSINLLAKLSQAEKNIYLLTSNCRLVIDPLLHQLDITRHFKKIITANDVENLKPTDAPFQLIRESNRPLGDYLMIGDSASDSDFATNAGIAYLDVKDIKANI